MTLHYFTLRYITLYYITSHLIRFYHIQQYIDVHNITLQHNISLNTYSIPIRELSIRISLIYYILEIFPSLGTLFFRILAAYQCDQSDHEDYYMYGCYSKDYGDGSTLLFNDKDNIDWDDFASYQTRLGFIQGIQSRS